MFMLGKKEQNQEAYMILWHSYLKSRFLYGCSIIFGFLSKSKQSQLQRLITTSLKQVMLLPKQANNEALLALMNLNSIHLNMMIQHAKIIKKIRRRFPKYSE